VLVARAVHEHEVIPSAHAPAALLDAGEPRGGGGHAIRGKAGGRAGRHPPPGAAPAAAHRDGLLRGLGVRLPSLLAKKTMNVSVASHRSECQKKRKGSLSQHDEEPCSQQ